MAIDGKQDVGSGLVNDLLADSVRGSRVVENTFVVEAEAVLIALVVCLSAAACSDCMLWAAGTCPLQQDRGCATILVLMPIG